MQHSLDKWLTVHEDVVLHIRQDYEVASAAVMVRSTPFGYCFLEEWIKLGTILDKTQLNWDNGDLLDHMMELVEPPMPECKEKRGKPDYLQCFRERFDRLLDLPKHLPIRVFFPGQGFWRDYVGDTVVEPGNPISQSDTFRRYFRTCAWPSDILGHAWKAFDKHWPQEYLHDLAKNVSAHDTFPECDKRYTLADELAMAQTCCFTLYPACANPDGGNRCHGPHCPKNPLWWHPNCTSIPFLAAPMD
ncbi:hypothetical protein COHA_000344 [Chlorella ohadii]|uniref:Uncharacterized protein n=1 Tax=Chlorella ohadii TaxID=2649997 RepID=A0AAD5E1A6_9CHLO|nr:hypothetical protein COHA_000344 [Chlorella ohadii]